MAYTTSAAGNLGSASDDRSGFLLLPLEIRLHIYRELLLAPTATITAERNLVSIPDYGSYENPAKGAATQGYEASKDRTLCFRNYAPSEAASRAAGFSTKHRSSYKIRSDRFRNRCIDAYYICLNCPARISPSILHVSRQIHSEAAPVLYSGYTFDFDTNIEACVPFLLDLTPISRSCVRRLGIVKRALPYDKDFDRAEWENMCECLATQLSLSSLSLGVVAGKPIMGWDEDSVFRFSKTEFYQIVQRDEMQWTRGLQTIQGLNRLDIRACVEHCPPSSSDAMDFFIAFSASVEFGFRDYLSEKLLSPHARLVFPTAALA